MISTKKGIMITALSLIQLVCMTIVFICENNIIDWCVVGFQGLILLVQILIMMSDTHKSNKIFF